VRQGAQAGIPAAGDAVIPPDEARTDTSTSTDEVCPICDGASEDETPCATCGGTGRMRSEYARGLESYYAPIADWSEPFKGKT
jgi:hypothetical protein